MAPKIKTPEIFSVLPYTGDKGMAGLPLPMNPYFVMAQEGNFMFRRTAIGTVIAREFKPVNQYLAPIGTTVGEFVWTGEKLPGRLISEATDYFRRIYDAHGTEAEVLITKKIDEEEYRLFVPHQRANGSGVKSIFEPSHIKNGWLIVGTIHSHCNFAAFHSGTDSGDAAKMDGVHFTIGMLKNETPQIVCMVAMGGKEYHFKDPAEIAEIEWTGHTAPLWWDAFLLQKPPAEKPKGFVSLTQNQWNEFLGASVSEPTSMTRYSPRSYTPSLPQSTHTPGNNWVPRIISPFRAPEQNVYETRRERKARLKNEQRNRNNTQQLLKYGDMLPGFAVRRVDDVGGRGIDMAIDVAIAHDILTDDDVENITSTDMSNEKFWIDLFEKKLNRVIDSLNALGMKVRYDMTDIGWTPVAPQPQRGRHI